MIPVLIDSELEAQLEKEGFVVLPFLNETEVSYLVGLYNKHHTDAKEGLYATAHSSDRDFKMNLNVEILKQFERAIAHYFLNCRPLGGSYITKYKGTSAQGNEAQYACELGWMMAREGVEPDEKEYDQYLEDILFDSCSKLTVPFSILLLMILSFFSISPSPSIVSFNAFPFTSIVNLITFPFSSSLK